MTFVCCRCPCPTRLLRCPCLQEFTDFLAKPTYGAPKEAAFDAQF